MMDRASCSLKYGIVPKLSSLRLVRVRLPAPRLGRRLRFAHFEPLLRQALTQTIFEALGDAAFCQPRLYRGVEPLVELQPVAAVETVLQVRLERLQRVA